MIRISRFSLNKIDDSFLGRRDSSFELVFQDLNGLKGFFYWIQSGGDFFLSFSMIYSTFISSL